MPRYFIKLAYNGNNYHGWQSQENAVSVQSELEKCMSLKLGFNVKLTGCGRTDTGVHAREFYAHFDMDNPFNQVSKKAFINNMNQFLPADISIFDIIEVDQAANARFDAISRTYKYYIHQQKNPFLQQYSFYHYGAIDLGLMNQACLILFDYEDFTSFSKLHSKTKTNICHISLCKWEQVGDQIIFTIQADRFLRNMVRAIVGTLLEIGKGKLTISGFREVIESKNRSKAGFSVPGHALFLEKVNYPETIFV